MDTYALECRMTKSLSMITSAPTFVVVTALQHHQPGGSWTSFFLCSPLAIWMHIFFSWLCLSTSSKESYRKQWALYTHSYKLITLCSLEWWAQTITSQVREKCCLAGLTNGAHTRWGHTTTQSHGCLSLLKAVGLENAHVALPSILPLCFHN